MSLLNISELTMSYNGPPLLDNVSCRVEEGQRIGLLGRNGAGKTTFMRLIAGQEESDSGALILASGKRLAMLQQDVPGENGLSISQVVAEGISDDLFDADSEEWQRANAIEQILSRMELDGDQAFDSLSSGMKRRVLLAKALVSQPDLLLLDEPTNHLDIEAIDWLEKFLIRIGKALIFVTHDRMFLRRMATRILEIDRGRLFDWSCDYDTFLLRKEQVLAAEDKQNDLFDKRLAEEEVWIRQGVKARRTRNEGRVRALKAMRSERADRRTKVGTSQLQIHQGKRSGDLVIEATDVGFQYKNGPAVLDQFSTTILRGDKIGIIGPNGRGKTTLLKILLGQLAPDLGTVKLGTNLDIAYFDQLREQLDENQSVADNVGDGYDHIEINGFKKHIYGYLQEFLFTPERSRTLIKFLSGGERNRILLAKLFTKPANLVILDEPTNDLDAETLEMLESKLVEYQGTILMVSHDREFLNNVVTSTIVFEHDQVNEYVGGYDDWVRQRPDSPSHQKMSLAKVGSQAIQEAGSLQQQVSKPKKLSFKHKRELESLPGKIETTELAISNIHSEMATADFYQRSGDLIAKKQAELKSLEERLKSDYERWEALEGLTL